jgi:hypothetical protein
MRTHTIVERYLAIGRGLQFIYQTACDRENFELYGYDYLCCFNCIASTSQDAGLRRVAREMGRERARQWRLEHPELPAETNADLIANWVIGCDAADRLGAPDPRLKKQLREAAGDFSARDYFWFEPTVEPPPADAPADCDCGADNERGRKRCRKCRKSLVMISRYLVLLYALIRSYMGERYGIRLGSRYADVVAWLPAMRPYPRYKTNEDDFYWAVYAVTHVVYTLNDYSLYRLRPRWLPDEFIFLKKNLAQAILMEDPETMGEFLDTLKSFGLTGTHPLIRRGMNYLLSTQNTDGSWGDIEAEDIYERYHPTWTAIDGLRDYAWRGERTRFRQLHLLA